MSIIIAIIALGFIIFIHEFGHFTVAKLFKVPVKEFSIGMGPRLVSKIWKNTRYSLKVFPFGGSCAMIGEDPAGDGSVNFEELGIEPEYKIDKKGLYDFDGVKFKKSDIDKYNYAALAPWKKFFICLAGPMMNFLLAFLLAFIIVSKIGFDVPIVSEVEVNSAAASGTPYALASGDIIKGLAIPGDKYTVLSYRDVALFMQLNDKDITSFNMPLAITFERDGKDFKTLVYPKYSEKYKKAMIGISFNNLYKAPTNLFDKCKYAIKEFRFYINTTIMSLRMLIRGRLSTNDVSGPVGTVAVMGSVINEAKTDITALIYTLFTLMVLISANLGVMNLLPIPALDGGRIVFAAIEMIIGRPIDKKIEATANTITMLLLLGFMIWVFGQDIMKIVNGTLIR